MNPSPAAGGRTAVVLFNLGGPDSAAAVRPFLFNLFNDPAIIALPSPFRWLLAKLIARRRAPVARAIYAELGGASPLLRNTEDQATALGAALAAPIASAGENGSTETDTTPARDYQVFVAMRYWHPFAEETVRQVMAFAPDRVVLLPLYPQYSSTTTGSSLDDWHRAARAKGLASPSRALCCYPTEAGFIDALAANLRAGLDGAGENARVLFSAHGLPKKFIDAGDPYQWQIEQSAAAIRARLARPGLDWRVCYQSRVGRLEWIGPSTEDEIRRAGAEARPVVVVPLAFVSEHSETLVELDIEYRAVADAAGVPHYVRVPTVGTAPDFIAGLAGLVRSLEASGAVLGSHANQRLCPPSCGRCALA